MKLTVDQLAELADVFEAGCVAADNFSAAHCANLAAPLIEGWLRAARAAAWDEGFDAGERDALDHDHFTGDTPCAANPYRERPRGGAS